MVLAMTHEEVVTIHVAQVVRSYRDLPLILYHFQTKERDEPRPRAGVLRTREFIMKDSYTFDRDAEGLDVGYEKHMRGLRPDLRPRRAGVVPRRVRRRDDGRHRRARVHGAVRGGRERRRAGARLRGQRRDRDAPSRSPSSCPPALAAPEEVSTPGLTTVADVAGALGVPAGALLKAYPGHRRRPRASLLVLVRGDHRVNEIKLRNALGADFRPAQRGGVRASGSARAGYIGPVGADVPILLDDARRAGRATSPAPTATDATCAASSRAATSRSSAADVRARRGRRHRRTATRSASSRRSRSATSSSSARATPCRSARPTSTRTASRAADLDGLLRHRPGAHRRRRGRAVRRRAGHLAGRARSRRGTSSWSALGKPGTEEHALAERLYDELREAGLDVLYDDRDAGPGEKFADAELLGCPLRLTVGRRTLEAGELEVQVRRGPRDAHAAARGRRRRRSRTCGGAPVERQLTFRRLSGLDRSGPPPPETSRRAAAPVDDPERDRLRPAGADPGVPGRSRSRSERRARRAAAAIVFAVIGWSDYLDGIAARVTGQYSRLGALLDPLVDRLLVLSGVIVCWHFELLPRWALALLAARELFMLVLAPLRAAAAASTSRSTGSGRWGVWPVFGSLFFAMCGVDWLALSCCTSGSRSCSLRRVQYVRDGVRQAREQGST